jgi:hypothetical protein
MVAADRDEHCDAAADMLRGAAFCAAHKLEEVGMRYKPKGIAALHIALGGLPDKMQVEVARGIDLSVNTVGDLRKQTAWPDNLVIVVPQERYPGSSVKVSKATAAGRTSPKP